MFNSIIKNDKRYPSPFLEIWAIFENDVVCLSIIKEGFDVVVNELVDRHFFSFMVGVDTRQGMFCSDY